MNYIHLTIEERACISKFKEMGLSLREMAKLLNRNVSTISREIKRNSYKTSVNYSVIKYSPTVAQRKKEDKTENKESVVVSKYEQSFNISAKGIDIDNIQANLENGILTLTLPKKEEVKYERKINIS